MTGKLDETYIAALQHDTAVIPEPATKIGVVRRPTPWFHSEVDENAPSLAPPTELLDEFKARYEERKTERQDISDSEAHNSAWEDIDFPHRYLNYLDGSDEAQNTIREIQERLSQGEDIILVCYENTEEKRCHRDLLLEYVSE